MDQDESRAGLDMYALIQNLYPICRSITGNGFRESMKILRQYIPIEINEVPTGTPVFDWTVPKEWNIRDAYVKDAQGYRLIDFQASNLHVVNYSIPVNRKMSLVELKEHLHTLPDYPDWIPYRTSYYKEYWGFCVSHNVMQNLEEGEYEVCIDSTLEPGHLTYGEFLLPGKTEDEVLISCHSCHPSLCNDNLSGMAVATYLAKHLQELSERRYSYRFLFIPGTIGSITWLALNEDQALRIKHGLVIACAGDPGKSTYKRSRRGDAEVDRAVLHVLEHSGQDYAVEDFSPYGYDERQYCSPGFNLPVGSLTRTPHGRYPEYHTSADNLELVQPVYLADSLAKYMSVIDILEHNGFYKNLSPKCEPQLGKRGLYGSFGGLKDTKEYQMAMLWVLNLSDGQNSLLDIADRSGIQFSVIHSACEALEQSGLLERLD